ncbi:hypothetical protein, partial [Kineosporia sp. NBRC 101731]|uniref:hypothetical protein n=1 Tax=Kineosporia sp. NBRC 101731 TaxID=3032199 RepID=UPI0025578997
EPAVEKLIEKDLMNSTERTARRTRRWQNDLAWHANRQDRLRRATGASAARADEEHRKPSIKPSHAPPSARRESHAEYGEPPF